MSLSHTHCTSPMELTKRNVKVHIMWGWAKGERELFQQNTKQKQKHFLNISNYKFSCNPQITIVKAIIFGLELTATP